MARSPKRTQKLQLMLDQDELQAIDDWRFASEGAAFSPLALSAAGDGFSYDLTLSTDAPMVLQGEGGYSVKSQLGQASYYYSQPFFEVSGTLTLGGREVEVTGQAWMDREWSTQPLAEDQSGWDWFSLRLGPDTALMLYRLRHEGGDDHLSGNWLGRDGTSDYLAPGTIEMTPIGTAEVAGREVPVRWRIEIPSRGVEIETEPLNPQSWMGLSFPYWEGPVRFSGTHEGRGYLEMTGY